MKIIGVLNWFNESPSWLAATVASYARVCDHLVAVDGRYALFSHDMNWSPVAEAQMIVEAAEGAGIPLTLHVPRQPFQGNEVEKRNLLFSLAMVHATPFEDWLLVIDADEYVVSVEDDFRDKVADTKEHAISFSLEEYCDPDDPQMPLSVAKMQSFPNVWRCPLRAMYRALPGIKYVGRHHSLGGFTRQEKWIWLWGHSDEISDRKLTQELVVRHRNPLRTKKRREQAADYYQARDLLGIEQEPALLR